MRKLLVVVAAVVATMVGAPVTAGALPPEAVDAGRPVTALLNGANEVTNSGVPDQGDLDATGTAAVTVDRASGRVCFDLSVTGTDAAAAAHIHEAPAGQNGPIVVTLVAPSGSPDPQVSSGCTTVADPVLTRLATNPAGFYVNVHTAAFTAGAVRGQLTTAATPLVATLTGANEVDGTTGAFHRGDPDGIGHAVVSIDAAHDLLCVQLVVRRIGTPAAAHIHEAGFDSTGGVVVTLPTPVLDADGDGVAVGCQAVDGTLADEILAAPADYYVNVHTAAFTDGAVRGQLDENGAGYRMVNAAGEVRGFGDSEIASISSISPTGAIRLTAPASGIAATPTHGGYWIATEDGGVVAFGDAPLLGSARGSSARPFIGIAATPTGQGYWLATDDGAVFAFGDATMHGSMTSVPLNQPIVGIAATPTGQGYYLVASDGGIFTFGDAVFLGSTGNIQLNQPVVGMAPTPLGDGYWLVASDGGIFAYGAAPFLGSTGAITLNQPVVDVRPTGTGDGYHLVATDGGIFSFGDAPFRGSLMTGPVVGSSR
jgi:hypothetical protein